MWILCITLWKFSQKMVNLFNYICGGVCQVDIYDLYLYFQRSVSFEKKIKKLFNYICGVVCQVASGSVEAIKAMRTSWPQLILHWISFQIGKKHFWATNSALDLFSNKKRRNSEQNTKFQTHFLITVQCSLKTRWCQSISTHRIYGESLQ